MLDAHLEGGRAQHENRVIYLYVPLLDLPCTYGRTGIGGFVPTPERVGTSEALPLLRIVVCNRDASA